jgi:hypothetical protein
VRLGKPGSCPPSEAAEHVVDSSSLEEKMTTHTQAMAQPVIVLFWISHARGCLHSPSLTVNSLVSVSKSLNQGLSVGHRWAPMSGDERVWAVHRSGKVGRPKRSFQIASSMSKSFWQS